MRYHLKQVIIGHKSSGWDTAIRANSSGWLRVWITLFHLDDIGQHLKSSGWHHESPISYPDVIRQEPNLSDRWLRVQIPLCHSDDLRWPGWQVAWVLSPKSPQPYIRLGPPDRYVRVSTYLCGVSLYYPQQPTIPGYSKIIAGKLIPLGLQSPVNQWVNPDHQAWSISLLEIIPTTITAVLFVVITKKCILCLTISLLLFLDILVNWPFVR